jgi:hypothetical protein
MTILLHQVVVLFRANGICREMLEVKSTSWNGQEIVCRSVCCMFWNYMLGTVMFVIKNKRWQGTQSCMNYVGSTMRRRVFGIEDSTVTQKLKVHK